VHLLAVLLAEDLESSSNTDNLENFSKRGDMKKALIRFAAVAALSVSISLFMAPAAHAVTLQKLQASTNAMQSTISTQAAQINALQQTVLALVGQIKDLNQKVNAYDSGVPLQIQQLQTSVSDILNSNVYALNPYVSVNKSAINGLTGPHVIFTGANVHIRSGAGSTNDGGILTGLGNLVIGYNEPRPDINQNPDLTGRGGSHNLIVGIAHKYERYGGFVAGAFNNISGVYSSASGGNANTASGDRSSVSGGSHNTAIGIDSSVSGGIDNIASGFYSSVSGGGANTASGVASSVSGGNANTASGDSSSVSGGFVNTASGIDSSVSGGQGVQESTDHEWAAGTLQSP
jgi:cell division protein FtsB